MSDQLAKKWFERNDKVTEAFHFVAMAMSFQYGSFGQVICRLEYSVRLHYGPKLLWLYNIHSWKRQICYLSSSFLCLKTLLYRANLLWQKLLFLVLLDFCQKLYIYILQKKKKKDCHFLQNITIARQYPLVLHPLSRANLLWHILLPSLLSLTTSISSLKIPLPKKKKKKESCSSLVLLVLKTSLQNFFLWKVHFNLGKSPLAFSSL